MMAAGLNVTLNTDDPQMFKTDVGHSYRSLCETQGWSSAQAIQLSLTGVEACWLPQPERTALRRRFAEDIAVLNAEFHREARTIAPCVSLYTSVPPWCPASNGVSANQVPAYGKRLSCRDRCRYPNGLILSKRFSPRAPPAPFGLRGVAVVAARCAESTELERRMSKSKRNQKTKPTAKVTLKTTAAGKPQTLKGERTPSRRRF